MATTKKAVVNNKPLVIKAKLAYKGKGKKLPMLPITEVTFPESVAIGVLTLNNQSVNVIRVNDDKGTVANPSTAVLFELSSLTEALQLTRAEAKALAAANADLFTLVGVQAEGARKAKPTTFISLKGAMRYSVFANALGRDSGFATVMASVVGLNLNSPDSFASRFRTVTTDLGLN